ncbi:MAG: LysM peptidoglycan-binding domain-containing protein [Sedimentitalea sp.]
MAVNKVVLFALLAAGAGTTGGLYWAGVIPPRLGLSEEPAPVLATAQPAAAPQVAPKPVIAPLQTPAVVQPDIKPDPQPEVAAAPQDPVVDAPDTGPVPDVPPAIDVIRIEPDGSAVLAGTAVPGSQVDVLLDADVLESFLVDGTGSFVRFLTVPPSRQARGLSLRATREDQTVLSLDQIILAPVTPPVVVAEVADAPGPNPAPEQAPVAQADPVVETIETPQPSAIETQTAPEPVVIATVEPVEDAPVLADPAPEPTQTVGSDPEPAQSASEAEAVAQLHAPTTPQEAPAPAETAPTRQPDAASETLAAIEPTLTEEPMEIGEPKPEPPESAAALDSAQSIVQDEVEDVAALVPDVSIADALAQAEATMPQVPVAQIEPSAPKPAEIAVAEAQPAAEPATRPDIEIAALDVEPKPEPEPETAQAAPKPDIPSTPEPRQIATQTPEPAVVPEQPAVADDPPAASVDAVDIAREEAVEAGEQDAVASAPRTPTPLPTVDDPTPEPQQAEADVPSEPETVVHSTPVSEPALERIVSEEPEAMAEAAPEPVTNEPAASEPVVNELVQSEPEQNDPASSAPVVAEVAAPEIKPEPTPETTAVATPEPAPVRPDPPVVAALTQQPRVAPAPDVISSAPQAVTPTTETAPDTGTTAVAVLRAGPDGIELLQPANPQRPQAMDRIALDTISYSQKGEVLLSGRAQGQSVVRVYLDNKAVTDLNSDTVGKWRGKLDGIAPGIYTLRLDEVSASGAVLSRIETPFKRESPDVLNPPTSDDPAQANTLIRAVTVQTGDTLWAISRERYGDGVLYVRVFEANRKNIRNPDLIYPGQVFTIPD